MRQSSPPETVQPGAAVMTGKGQQQAGVPGVEEGQQVEGGLDDKLV
jgi:hypothetical protein